MNTTYGTTLDVTENTGRDEIREELIDHIAAETFLAQTEQDGTSDTIKTKMHEVRERVRREMFEGRYGEDSDQLARFVFLELSDLRAAAELLNREVQHPWYTAGRDNKTLTWIRGTVASIVASVEADR